MKKVYADVMIVDQDDRPIGQMQLPDAVKAGHFLRVSRAHVINAKGEMLLQLRSDKVWCPNIWNEAASGHVDAGETYLSTMVRELSEEAGITVQEADLEEIDNFYLEEGTAPYVAKRFHRVYRLQYDGPVQADGDEVAELRWVSTDDLIAEIAETPDKFSKSFRQMLDVYLKKFGKH